MVRTFQVYPIGVVHRHAEAESAWIDIEPQFEDGLLGLDRFSHISVLYWFDRNDTLQQRGILRVHPRKDPANPLTGVFATHAPVRPNLIALTTCRLLSIEGRRLYVEKIDAMEGSPVLDIKCYIPCRQRDTDIRVPEWVHKSDDNTAAP